MQADWVVGHWWQHRYHQSCGVLRWQPVCCGVCIPALSVNALFGIQTLMPSRWLIPRSKIDDVVLNEVIYIMKMGGVEIY